jgi:hypothetical protein
MEVFGGHDAACFSSIRTRRPAMAIQLYDRFNYVITGAKLQEITGLKLQTPA